MTNHQELIIKHFSPTREIFDSEIH